MANAKKEYITITRQHFDEVGNALTQYGFMVTGIVGSGANDGYVFKRKGIDGYIEVWDNSDNKRPNVAIRPTHSLVKALSLNLDALNKRANVRVTTPKGHLTARIAVYSQESLDYVLPMIIGRVNKLKPVQPKAKQETA